MFTLFDDQVRIQNLVLSYFAQGLRRVLMVSPTGSGKTVTFCDMALKAVNKGKRVLVLCHLEELIFSAKEKLNEFGLFPHLIISGSKENYISLISVASIQTIRNRDFQNYDLIIVDEAHRCDFDKLILKAIELFNPFIVGVSASPVRVGAQRCLSTMYQAMAEVSTIKQLIANGRLSPCRTFTVKKDFSKVAMKGNDFDEHAIADAFNKAEMYDDMVGKYKEFADGTSALIFNSNVPNSITTCDKFREEGYECAHVDGKTPTWKRIEIVQDLKHKPGMIVTNCRLFSAGVDIPSLQTVVKNFSSMSLPLNLQVDGRGGRVFPGKTHFNSIDMGSNVYRHGLWHMDRNWSLEKKPKGKSDGVAGVKVCSACSVINFASARKCASCGAILINPVEKMLKNGEFMEITSEMERGVEAYFDKSKASLKELHKYAKQKGYSAGWAKIQYDIQQKNKEAKPFQRGVS